MPQDSTRWKLRYKVAAVMVLVSPGVLGVSSIANASPSATAHVAPGLEATAIVTSDTLPRPVPSPGPSVPRPADTPESRANLKPMIDAAVKIIKALPGWWSKFSTGVKNAYSWFVKYVWKPLCAIATAIQIWVTGWDLWNWFH
ncbi:MAG: hypothetical protein JWP75_2746 [Frondihabitans sp.]|nr:hypothetical protein [Frondihabitans sp.]